MSPEHRLGLAEIITAGNPARRGTFGSGAQALEIGRIVGGALDGQPALQIRARAPFRIAEQAVRQTVVKGRAWVLYRFSICSLGRFWSKPAKERPQVEPMIPVRVVLCI